MYASRLATRAWATVTLVSMARNVGPQIGISSEPSGAVCSFVNDRLDDEALGILLVE